MPKTGRSLIGLAPARGRNPQPTSGCGAKGCICYGAIDSVGDIVEFFFAITETLRQQSASSEGACAMPDRSASSLPRACGIGRGGP